MRSWKACADAENFPDVRTERQNRTNMSIFSTVASWFSGGDESARSALDAIDRESNGATNRSTRSGTWNPVTTNERRIPVSMGEPFKLETGFRTDPGCVRELNEDTVVLKAFQERCGQEGQYLLAMVCDGMGGHEAGEVASAIAGETVQNVLQASDSDMPMALVAAIKAANNAIFKAARENPRLSGMGTTCCALVISEGSAWCAHVGDSRCYLLRDGSLLLMTEDHSAVMEMVRRGLLTLEEARTHPDRNVISRALGNHGSVEVSSWSHPLVVQPDDAFLICSDGLYDLVGDADIQTVMTHGNPHSQVACDRLITLARERGGTDNITAVVVRFRSGSEDTGGDAVTRTVATVA